MLKSDIESRIDYPKVMADIFNKAHTLVEFPPGSYVMAREEVMEGRLDPKYDGSFKVIRKTEFSSYELEDMTEEKVSCNFAPEQLKHVTQALDSESQEHYEIDETLEDKETVEGMRYLVKWKNHSEMFNSWIASELYDSPVTIHRY